MFVWVNICFKLVFLKIINRQVSLDIFCARYVGVDVRMMMFYEPIDSELIWVSKHTLSSG